MKFALILAVILAANSIWANNLSYFKDSYEEANAHFDQIYNQVKPQFAKAEVFQFLYNQGNIKSYFFSPNEKSETLLVFISGVHGIEAHTGSAVQRYLLENKLKSQKTSFLLIHGFNLWGFKNGRRVNENNIDLNRAFIINRSQFKSDDSGYASLNSFLNPTSQAKFGLLSHASFVTNALYQLSQNSIEILRHAILKGQYSHPKGIFYGGSLAQEQELMIEQLVARYFAPYKKVILVDLHTGYGERGRLHLLAGPESDPNSVKLKKLFGEGKVDFADKAKFYSVQGEMITFFGTKIFEKTGADITGVTFEYGTLDSQKTLGSIESLRRIVLENQNFHFPAENNDSDQIKNIYREMFYPSDEAWRKTVLQQTDTKLSELFKNLN
jgi:hypothetical protein